MNSFKNMEIQNNLSSDLQLSIEQQIRAHLDKEEM
jgi:hypothetical protein